MTIYHEGQRELQDRFDTRRLADRIDDTLMHDTILPDEKSFIESRDMFFIATSDANGNLNCSYRGGDPGFVRVIDERTLVFPNYDGNGMFLTTGNIQVTKQVGLLFIDFERGSRMRINGTAEIVHDDPLMKDFVEAQFLVRVTAREVFPNCPRYIHKMKLVERSRFVPKAACETPVPSWKKFDWSKDVLSENDPARDSSREVI